jgi:hypothetical protein
MCSLSDFSPVRFESTIAVSWVSVAAIQKLEQEAKWVPITTSSKALDRLFGSSQGVPPGKITEICGLAGSGKTQIGYDLDWMINFLQRLFFLFTRAFGLMRRPTFFGSRSLQLCINAQIPSYAGGAGGTAIFVGKDATISKASDAFHMPSKTRA